MPRKNEKEENHEQESLSKDAGMKYIVIMSKHHDGFAIV